jgi:hypothetical protein
MQPNKENTTQMKKLNFHFNGIYYREINPKNEFINKSNIRSLFDRLYTYNKYKYYDVIRLHPIVDYNGPKKINHILYLNLWEEVSKLTELVFYKKGSNKYWDEAFRIGMSQDETEKYIIRNAASLNHKFINENKIEYLFSKIKVVLISRNEGMGLTRIYDADGIKPLIEEFQFISYNKVADDYILHLYEFDLFSQQ